MFVVSGAEPDSLDIFFNVDARTPRCSICRHTTARLDSEDEVLLPVAEPRGLWQDACKAYMDAADNGLVTNPTAYLL